jgi:hypothetical protein
MPEEYGQAKGLGSESICCLLLPGLAFADLPPRYDQRQNLSASDFMAYPKLLDWICGRLKDSR